MYDSDSYNNSRLRMTAWPQYSEKWNNKNVFCACVQLQLYTQIIQSDYLLYNYMFLHKSSFSSGVTFFGWSNILCRKIILSGCQKYPSVVSFVRGLASMMTASSDSLLTCDDTHHIIFTPFQSTNIEWCICTHELNIHPPHWSTGCWTKSTVVISAQYTIVRLQHVHV